MDEDIVIPVVLFLSIVVVAVSWFYFRARQRADLQVTIRQAVEQGQQLSPELIERLAGAVNPAQADVRRAAVFLSLGVGLVAFALILNEPDAVRPLLACAAFPVTIGLAYLTLWWRSREQ